MQNKWRFLKQYSLLLFTGLCASPALAQPCTQLLIASYTPGTVCTTRPLNLSANTIAGATYSWTGPAGFASIAQNPSISSVTLAQSGSFVVTATAGSCIYKDTVNITVNTTPATPLVTTSTPPCKGSNLFFSISSTGAGTNTVYNPSGVQMPSPSIFNLATSHNGTYKVVRTATNGCKSDTGYYPLQVIDLPMPTLLADTPICRGDTLHMYVMNNTPFVDNYYWNTPTGNPFYTPPTALHLPNVIIGGFYTVQTVLDGCLSPVSYTLIGFKPSVYANVAATVDGEIQANYTELTFTAHITNGGGSPTVQWFKNGAPLPGATDTVYKGILFTDVMPMDWLYAQVQRDSACGGISYSDTMHVNELLHVDNLQESNGISLYPNPNTGIFSLQSSVLKGNSTIEIVNSVGQRVYSGAIDFATRIQIELPVGVSNGVYFLRMTNGEQSHVHRFMVNR